MMAQPETAAFSLSAAPQTGIEAQVVKRKRAAEDVLPAVIR
jgi:hypothetical protein